MKNTILGAGVGLIVILLILFIKEMSNKTFKTEEDIVNTLDVPLIGVIPKIDRKEFNK